jgi:hypothetical protein
MIQKIISGKTKLNFDALKLFFEGIFEGWSIKFRGFVCAHYYFM